MRKIILSAILAAPFAVCAQLSITTTNVATTLAQTIAGNGVTVSSASLNCGANAAGTFSYTGSNLGMTGGIILTTGVASDAANPGSFFCDQQNGNFYNDPDLTSVEPNATNDVCLLEFDFIPICSNINITFVFGSEEYPTFVNSFNDGFGIFLTGPNPSGGNYNATNIGVLPNGTAVSINNVNANTNSSYFHINYTPPGPVNNDIAYDGYTHPITSATPVAACSTYHMKIAIADALDEAYDSGVFIGSNAVSCTNAPNVTASSSPASCGGSNGSVTCSVTNYTGTVTYQWLPGNQTTPTVSNLPVGNYTCVVTYTAGCSSATTTSVVTTIANQGSNLTLSTATQSVTCPNSTNGSATVTPAGGTSPYTYTWNTTPPQTGATATNLSAGVYQVTVQDNGGCIGNATVTIGIANPTVLQIATTATCGTIETFTAPAGSAYQWYGPSNTSIPGATSSIYNASGFSSGQYFTVGFTDNTTGCRDSVRYTITQLNIGFTPAPSPPCAGGAGSLQYNPAGNNPYTSFDWNMSGSQSGSGTAANPVIASGLTGGVYNFTISVSGNPTCFYTTTYTLLANQIPATVVDTIRACNADTVNLNPNIVGSTYMWYDTLGHLISNPATGPLPLYPLPYSGLNVNTAGATYLDTIRSSSGCKSVYKAVIKQTSFNAQISSLAAIKCHNDSTGKLKVIVVRENNGPINKPYTFNWHYPSPYNSPGTVSANPPVPVSSIETTLHPGFYYCIVKAGNCVDTLSYTLANPAALPLDTMNAYYCPKDSLALIVASPSHSPYHWLNNNVPVTAAQNTNYNNDSIYVVTADIGNYSVYYLKNGCRDSAKLRIDHPIYNAFRPDVTVNIFTPNGDKRNDAFYPFHDPKYTQYQIDKQMELFEMHIYNRWGREIFETTEYAKPWEGKTTSGEDVDDGTYFWIVKYKSNCSSKADVVEKKGFVQLLR